MGTRRLIALRSCEGFACVHLTCDGDLAPDILEEDYAEPGQARNLVSHGDLHAITATSATLVTDPSLLGTVDPRNHRTRHCASFDELFELMYGNEHLVSIYDGTGTLAEDFIRWSKDSTDEIPLSIDETVKGAGRWMHLIDDEELGLRFIADHIADAA